MPIRHADTTNIATRFAFPCSIRFDLKDNSDYEKTVDKESREKITPKKQELRVFRRVFRYLQIIGSETLLEAVPKRRRR